MKTSLISFSLIPAFFALTTHLVQEERNLFSCFKRLYSTVSIRLFVGWSVGWLVGWSVGWLVGPSGCRQCIHFLTRSIHCHKPLSNVLGCERLNERANERPEVSIVELGKQCFGSKKRSFLIISYPTHVFVSS